MSMLAEKKIKQKWSLNPRGKAWSEDRNKFGQKMLEKMGWSHGKGLGAKEDGIVENLKVSYKNDSKGMGYKDSNDQWIEHDTNFNALLQSLSDQTETQMDFKISSLEKKSQTSKVRVHYKKFTRGKDLSLCTEKDLASIFGKKSLSQHTNGQETEPQTEPAVHRESDFIKNRGSMIDYFKKKNPNLNKILGKNNGYIIGSNGVLKKDTDSEEETHMGFGFTSESGKKRKSLDSPSDTPKKQKCGDLKENGLRNPAFDPLFNKIEVKKHVLNTIKEEEPCADVMHKEIDDYDDDTPKKSNKMQKNNHSVENINIHDSLNDRYQNFEKKKKKKDKTVMNMKESSEGKNKSIEIKLAIENPTFQMSEGSENDYVDDCLEVKRSKKSKKKNSIQVDVDSTKFEANLSRENMEIARKKKKRKISDKNLALDNPNFDNNLAGEDNSSYNNENYEVKRKIKKKEHEESLAISNPNFNDSSFGEDISCHNNESYEIKRKKKKSKVLENLAIDNPNFENSAVEEEVSISYNKDFEVKRKKKKKSHSEQNCGLDNPGFHELKNGDSPHCYTNGNFEIKCVNGQLNAAFANDCSEGNSSLKKQKKNKSCTIEKVAHASLAVNGPSKKSSTNYLCEESLHTPKQNNVGHNGEEPTFDLILNITSTPSFPKTNQINNTNNSEKLSRKRRKSVRFSDVTEERIIPNNEDAENRNELFDINSKVIANSLKHDPDFTSHQISLEENIDEISKKIDGFQAEIENDINEKKIVKFIGEVGNPEGDNEKLPDGTKLKFKYAQFGRTLWYNRNQLSKAKSSYKHLIKGDVIVAFNNTNLHEIEGYGTTKNTCQSNKCNTKNE